jgi:hypothetical protein
MRVADLAEGLAVGSVTVPSFRDIKLGVPSLKSPIVTVVSHMPFG